MLYLLPDYSASCGGPVVLALPGISARTAEVYEYF